MQLHLLFCPRIRVPIGSDWGNFVDSAQAMHADVVVLRVGWVLGHVPGTGGLRCQIMLTLRKRSKA